MSEVVCLYCNDTRIVPKGYTGQKWWEIPLYLRPEQKFEECPHCPPAGQGKEPEGEAGAGPIIYPIGVPRLIVISATAIPIEPREPAKLQFEPYRGVRDAIISDGRYKAVNPEKVAEIIHLLQSDLESTESPLSINRVDARVAQLVNSSFLRDKGIVLNVFARDRVEEALAHLSYAAYLLTGVLAKIDEADKADRTENSERDA